MTHHKIPMIIATAAAGMFATHAEAQLFENLEKFVDRVNVGDPEVGNGREGPKGLALVDFDADGKLDIAASNLDGTVSIAYGQGGLAFEKAVHLRTGSLTLRQLVADDVNADGRADLITAAPHEGLVHVFLNQGNRKFAASAPIAAWPTSRNLSTGDFNGDGKLDVAVSGRDRGVVLYSGDGSGVFVQEADAGPELWAVDSEWGFRPVYSLQTVRAPGAATDQLLVTHANTSICWTLDGTGKILNKAFLSHQPHALKIGSIAEKGDDGLPSVISADKSLGTVELRLLNAEAWASGVPQLEPNPYQIVRVPGAPRYVEIADIDNDGWNDMVVVLRNFDRLITYKNEAGKMVASSEMPVGTSPRELAAGDLNDDGLTDFVVINRWSQDVSALLASDQGTGFQALDQVYPETGEVAGLEIYDLNRDGLDDIVQIHRASGDVSVRMARKGGKLSEPAFYYMGTFPSSIFFKDLNNDQVMDISTANLGRADYIDGSVSVRLGNVDGTFNELLNFKTEDGSAIFAIVSQDFNGDGKMDFAVGYFDCRLSFYQGMGDDEFKHTRTIPFTYESRVMTTGDWDQDGDYDIAGAGYAGNVVILENDGDLLHRTGDRLDYKAGGSGKIGTREITTSDINEDGDPDLLIGTGDGVVAYLGGAGSTFKEMSERLPGTEFPASSLVASDFDNDGIEDIAVSCRVLSCVIILKGEGKGSYVPALTVDVPSGEFVRTGDIDGDGLADLIGSGGALWVALSSRSPGEAPPWNGVPIRPPKSQVMINEILASNNRYRFPGAGENTPDAVEVYNGYNSPISVGGWTLRRIHTLPSGQREIREGRLWGSIEANGRRVVYCDKSNNGYTDGSWLQRVNFKLPASGATLELVNPEGKIVDSVTYPPLELNHSFARYQDGIESFRHNMLPDIGEMNVDNGSLEPTVFFDGFTANTLEAGVPIKLTARANDDVGVIGLTVAYRRVDIEDAPIEKILLYDDGAHDDGEMLDGVFAGELPALPDRAEIQFFVEAVDLNNKTVTLPGDPVFAPRTSAASRLNQIYTLSIGNPLEHLEISEIVTDNESLWQTFDHVDENGQLVKRWLNPDYIELRNTGHEPIDLSGLSMGQSFFEKEENLFTFEDGTVISPASTWSSTSLTTTWAQIMPISLSGRTGSRYF